MIRQLLVLDEKGDLQKHVATIFSSFIRGYQVFHATSPDEAVELAKKQMIDVVAINGNDFAKSFSAGTIKMLKRRIFPVPKILLLLEPNLIDTLPGLEGKADYVLNSTTFSALKFQRIVNDLTHKKYNEEYEREIQEMADKRQQAEWINREFEEICEELERKVKSDTEGAGGKEV